jgi:hypothetical protein
LYQQAAIWFIRWEDWLQYPASILLAAANLEANPDCVDDTNRFEVPPRQLRFPQCKSSAKEELSPPLCKIINMLLPSEIAPALENDRSIAFGEDEFETETEFLTAVATALQFLPENYGRWPDFSVASGLRHERKGLFLKYLPSVRGQSGIDISEQVIRRRLERKTPKARLTRGAILNSSRSAGTSGEPRGLAGTVDGRRSLSDLVEDFRQTLTRYRQHCDATSAISFVMSVEKLQEPGRDNQLSTLRQLIDRERVIVLTVFSALDGKPIDLSLGAMFDLINIFWLLRGHTRFERFVAPLVSALKWKLAKAKVLFPVEHRLISSSPLNACLIVDECTKPVLQSSNALSQWLTAVRPPPVAREVPLMELQYLSYRLRAVFGQELELDSAGTPYTGIHERYIVTLDAVLGQHDYDSTARELLITTLPWLVNQLTRLPFAR